MRAVRMARGLDEHGFVIVFEDATVAVLDPEALVRDYHTSDVRGELEIIETHYLPPGGHPLVPRVEVMVHRDHLEVVPEGGGAIIATIPGGFYSYVPR